MTEPIQQRRLEDKVFNQSRRNSEIIVWLAETALRFENCGRRKIPFLQPCIANRSDGCIEVMIEIVKRVKSKNVPAGNSRSANHSLANGDKRIDFVEPTHCQALGRQEVVERGDHDSHGAGGSDAIAEPMQSAKRRCLPLKPFA